MTYKLVGNKDHHLRFPVMIEERSEREGERRERGVREERELEERAEVIEERTEEEKGGGNK